MKYGIKKGRRNSQVSVKIGRRRGYKQSNALSQLIFSVSCRWEEANMRRDAKRHASPSPASSSSSLQWDNGRYSCRNSQQTKQSQSGVILTANAT